MNWIDGGYLLSKTRYNENSIIAEFYTENYGKCSGLIFGATSKKIKNYLEIGNKVHLNHNSKNDSKLGYFKIEILKALTPLYFDNKKKLMCLSSAINLVRILTVESEKNIKIFELIDEFFLLLEKKDWIKNYILWELELLKLVGYDLELKNYINTEITENKNKYFVNINNKEKIIPNFLIDLDDKELDNNDLINGLNLVGDYMVKSILKPNNINYPFSRLNFVNLLK